MDSTLLMLQLGKVVIYGNSVVSYFRFKFEAVFLFKWFSEIGVHELRAYDRAAIKFRGVDADINFNLSDYEDDLKQVRFTS